MQVEQGNRRLEREISQAVLVAWFREASHSRWDKLFDDCIKTNQLYGT